MGFKTAEIRRKYYRDYYVAKMKELRIELGNKCMHCGWDTVPDVLEFAHVHGTKKHFSIGHIMRKSKQKTAEEVKKCILLCPTCHRVYDLATGCGRVGRGELAESGLLR